MSPVPPEVSSLVERFTRNRESYKNPAYNEAQVRREFLDPLFKALGWDVDDEQGLAEAYKDVIHEDAIKIGGATKAPVEKTAIQRQIDATDRQIDRLVYQLYELTDDEIRVVEEATG